MSTTTNIGLFKHDNPATNTDEFNVDKALNENWDKLDTAIGTDRERITTLETDNTTNKQDITDIKAKDTEQYKYISELEAENTRLKEDLNGLPKGQVSGETIDLTDSAEMRCELKISGNSKQETREGYNLIDTDKEISLIKNMTRTDNITPKNKVELEAGTYTIYLPDLKLNNSNYGIYCEMVGIENKGDIFIDKIRTITLKEKLTLSRLYFYLDSNDNDNATAIFSKVMILKGAYTAETLPPYEAYGAMPSPDYRSEVECCGDNGNINEVICNKNLLPINVTEKTMYGITITKKSDGTYSLNGTATTSFTFDLYSGDYIKLPSGTYTGQSGQMLGFYIRKDSGDYQTLSETNKKTNTFTITEDFIYNRIYMYIFSGKTYNNTILTPMLEEGSIATEFEEHQSQTYTIPTQQPFRAIGDIRDTFIKKNDKWYERHYIGEVVLDGINVKFVGKSGTANNFFITDAITNMKLPTTNSKIIECLNTHFIGTYSTNGLYSNGNNIGQSVRTNGSIGIGFGINSSITTVELANSWLSNNNVKVYYPLQVPEDIECTEEQNTILDQIEKEAKTYKNITHMYSTDNVSPVIDVTYKKDIDTMITNIEQAILSQGGNI